jgi:hypothetical protein
VTDEKPPPIASELVAEFVLKAHGDLEFVKKTVESEPAIVNAAWDWGGGDWETGLGAAAHVGRRDIAEYLLDRGARKDVFAAAMLGEADVVRAMLEAQPGLRDARGPHGIPLRAHAEAGGEQARDVLDLLQAVTAGQSSPAVAGAAEDSAPVRPKNRTPTARVDGSAAVRVGEEPRGIDGISVRAGRQQRHASRQVWAEERKRELVRAEGESHSIVRRNRRVDEQIDGSQRWVVQ